MLKLHEGETSTNGGERLQDVRSGYLWVKNEVIYLSLMCIELKHWLGVLNMGNYFCIQHTCEFGTRNSSR